MNPGDGGLRAFEDNVLHFLNVNLRGADRAQNACENSRPIQVAHREDADGGRLAGEVNHVRYLPGCLEGADDANGFGGNRLPGLLRGCADMVRAVNAGQLCNRVVEVARAGGRLLREDVETGAYAAFSNRAR